MNDEGTSTLRQAAERLEPDVERLVAGGTARGRRLRRRHRVGSSLAAVAAVGVVAASVAVVPQLLDGGSDTGQLAADPTPVPTETTTPPADPPPPTHAPDPSVRAGDLPALVTSQFPGTVTDAPERTGGIMNGGESFQVAHFLWDGYLMSVGAMSSGKGDPTARCQDHAGKHGTCTQRPDGSALLAWGETGPEVDGGVTGRGVSLYVEGWEVFAIAYNAADGKESPLLADEPPFTHDQLEQIVSDPAWFD
jgi:hypothetical protein